MAEMTKPEKKEQSQQARRVETLAGTGATDDEIALQVDMPVEKLQRKFGPVLRRARSTFRVRLRARQVTLALQAKGGERMLLWLGRQYLGQKESPAIPADNAGAAGKVYIGVRIDDI
jgi:hypothetical protein